VETPDVFSEHWVGLTVIKIWFMPEILPNSISDFLPQDLRTLAHQRIANAKKIWLCFAKISLVLQTSLVSYFPCPKSIVRLLVTPRLLLCCCSPHWVVSVHIPEQRMKLQMLWTARTPCLHPLYILEPWASGENFPGGATSAMCLFFSDCWRWYANWRSQKTPYLFYTIKNVTVKVTKMCPSMPFWLMFLFTQYKTACLTAISTHCLGALPAKDICIQ